MRRDKVKGLDSSCMRIRSLTLNLQAEYFSKRTILFAYCLHRCQNKANKFERVPSDPEEVGDDDDELQYID